MHPDVLYVPESFGGFKYWLAFTPYPGGDDRFENPSIRASRDGLSWHQVPGSIDPLVEAPPDTDAHNADPDLTIVDGRLHLVYMTRNKRTFETTFSVITSDDGADWSEPRVIYRETWGVSPALVVRDGQWHMWYVWLDRTHGALTGSRILRRDGEEIGALENQVECELEIPGWTPWHIDVIWSGGRYEALVAAFGPHGDSTSLFHCVSEDGLRFRPSSPSPLLGPSRFGWDNRLIYRSTMMKEDPDRYRIWYSAVSWGGLWGIGALEGPLDRLVELKGARAAQLLGRRRRALADVSGLARYLARQYIPERHLNRIRRSRDRLTRRATP